MKKTTELLKIFFESTGNEADSLIFLKNFQSLDPEKFALIYINTEIILDSFTTFFYDLKILYGLGLYPVILVSSDSISYISLFYKGIFSDSKEAFRTDEPNCEILQFSSDVSLSIKSSIEKKRIPFLVLESEENLFEIVADITSKLHTSKFIFLNHAGPLRNKISNEKISIINIRSDYENLVKEEILRVEDKVFLDQLKHLLESKITHTMNIAITSPITLLKELFTVNGSGTFIKLGSEIRHINGIDKLDKKKLAELLESAFRKKIQPEFLESKVDSIFLEANYRGAAILKINEFGALLSKFAVDEIARGEGIGRDIWNEMKKTHKTIFWRAKPENQIHKWYAKECQGMDKGKDWNVYWINLEVDLIAQVCKLLRSQAQDFKT